MVDVLPRRGCGDPDREQDGPTVRHPDPHRGRHERADAADRAEHPGVSETAALTTPAQDRIPVCDTPALAVALPAIIALAGWHRTPGTAEATLSGRTRTARTDQPRPRCAAS